MIVGNCSHYRAPKALCASIAVVIDWAAKSHKMSLTTLFHSYQSVSYFSLSLTVTCLSFPIPGESSSRWLENLPNLFSSAQLISSTGQAVRWHWQRFQHCRCWSTLNCWTVSWPCSLRDNFRVVSEGTVLSSMDSVYSISDCVFPKQPFFFFFQMMLFRIYCSQSTLSFLSKIAVWRNIMSFYGYREVAWQRHLALSHRFGLSKGHMGQIGETFVCVPSVLYGVNYPKTTIWTFHIVFINQIHSMCFSLLF